MQACTAPAKMAAEYASIRRKGDKSKPKGRKTTIGEMMGAKRKTDDDDEGDD